MRDAALQLGEKIHLLGLTWERKWLAALKTSLTFRTVQLKFSSLRNLYISDFRTLVFLSTYWFFIFIVILITTFFRCLSESSRRYPIAVQVAGEGQHLHYTNLLTKTLSENSYISTSHHFAFYTAKEKNKRNLRRYLLRLLKQRGHSPFLSHSTWKNTWAVNDILYNNDR